MLKWLTIGAWLCAAVLRENAPVCRCQRLVRVGTALTFQLALLTGLSVAGLLLTMHRTMAQATPAN